MPARPAPLTLQGLARLLREQSAATDRAIQALARRGEETERRLEVLAALAGRTEGRLEALAERQEATERAIQALVSKGKETDRWLEAFAAHQDAMDRRLHETNGGIQMLTAIMQDLGRKVARHNQELIALRTDTNRAFHVLEQQGARLEEQGQILQRLMDHLRGRGGDGGVPPPTP